ncbi:MAG: cyclopropane-fatty-acyl-phospholipid synthase family protein [Thiolinea sp.]
MKSNTLALSNNTHVSALPLPARWVDRLAKRILQKKFSQLEYGRITLHDGKQQDEFGQISSICELSVHIYVHEQSAYSDVVFGGTIGSGEAYMARSWSCDDLTALVRILLLNRKVLDGLDSGAGKLLTPLYKGFHWLHRNSLQGSRKNISAHYDLGNDMFELFLDPTMMYSSGIFESRHATMEEASEAKLERICQKLQLTADDHILEIGTGWGGFALYAAENYGCRVTTTTISQQQFEYARQRIEDACLSDRIEVLCQDYRELTGVYDKLVSIEMIEAVGHKYFSNYFRQCSRLLKPDGMMLLQAITIDDRQYEIAKREVDFIQRYIFPGGCLPSVHEIGKAVAKSTDMRIFHLDDIGPHYAITLRKWRERFSENKERIRKLGYSDTFMRMWEYYLCYCEGGFEERAIGTVQVLMTKPLCRRETVF